MRRARKHAVAVAIAALATLAPASAWAFHAGDVFDKPPGAGGGGGIFYIGVPSERGWTCAGCHTDAPGTIRIELDSNPRSLFDSGSYAPGQAYAISAKLIGEHEGLNSPLANFNSLGVEVVDAKGNPAGTIAGYAAEDFYASGPATIMSAGQRIGATSWTFTWHAPPTTAGRLSIHVAAVDGNGANSGPNGTLTDPWGDDVFVGALSLDPPAAPSQQSVGLGVVGLMIPWALRRVRRWRKEMR
jgi:hypothetical protein